MAGPYYSPAKVPYGLKTPSPGKEDPQMHTLKNDILTVNARPQGAELTSIRRCDDGLEYLWQADKEYWNWHAPLLFPIVGRLKNDQYHHEDTTYTMAKHGFARNSLFILTDRTQDTLAYTLADNEDTRAAYPFAFQLDITYRLNESTLHVDWVVYNPADVTLYFSIGAHPAFNCPLNDGETMKDYEIQFSRPENAARLFFDENGLCSHCDKSSLDNTSSLALAPERFHDDAIVYRDLASDTITLRDRKGNHSVHMSCPDFPYFGIWSPAQGAPFVCLEPWYGLPDNPKSSGDLTAKAGIQTLAPYQTFNAQYSMAFE
jgi:galactose mutarotase-like enzyme